MASFLQFKRAQPPLSFICNKVGQRSSQIHFALNNSMAERRKIIIETGAEPSEPLPTPHFDAEATLTARPVIPLTDQEIHRTNYGDYAARPAKPFWKRPALLVPVILAAVGIGIAAGFAIGIYRNQSAAQAPVATAPTTATAPENTDLSKTVEPPPLAEEVLPEPEARIPVVSETEETKEDEEREERPAAPKVEERERSARDERRRDDDDDNEARQPVAVKPPAAARERKPVKVDEYSIEDERAERRAERERRREERRDRRRRQREDEISVPRGIERGVREADRIREIFEGRQP